MFTFERKHLHASSWTFTYLFLFLLIANQFLAIHSYVYVQHGQEQVELIDLHLKGNEGRHVDRDVITLEMRVRILTLSEMLHNEQ